MECEVQSHVRSEYQFQLEHLNLAKPQSQVPARKAFFRLAHTDPNSLVFRVGVLFD